MITTGSTAPDFVAPAVTGTDAGMLKLFETIRDHDAVVLLFYPADFVPACTAELCAVSQAGWPATENLAVVGVSGDSLFSHAAYADWYSLSFPIVSDFHAGIAENYGLVAEQWEGHDRIPRRATVVIDDEWDVRAVEDEPEATAAADPAPVERAVDALLDLGCSIDRPVIQYDDYD